MRPARQLLSRPPRRLHGLCADRRRSRSDGYGARAFHQGTGENSMTHTNEQYPRGIAFPLPTVAQIEDALDTLLTAIIAHERTRKAAPQNGPLLISARDLMLTEFLPGEMFIEDP